MIACLPTRLARWQGCPWHPDALLYASREVIAWARANGLPGPTDRHSGEDADYGPHEMPPPMHFGIGPPPFDMPGFGPPPPWFHPPFHWADGM